MKPNNKLTNSKGKNTQKSKTNKNNCNYMKKKKLPHQIYRT